MKVGLDIDSTITANPAFYYELSQGVYDDGGAVVILTSRVDTGHTRLLTESELQGWSIRYDALYLFKPFEEVEHLCPHKDLDWYQRYLWQKVHHAVNEQLDIHYDDDDAVISLFKRYAPEIKIVDAKTMK